MDDQDLYDEIIWVMQYYGSPAMEKEEPGSRLKCQAERIIAFITERREAQHWINQHGFRHIKIVRSML